MYIFYTALMFILVILFLVLISTYALTSFTYYSVMKKNNCSYAWAAWLPSLGGLMFTSSYLKKIEAKYNIKNLNVLYIIALCFLFFGVVFLWIPVLNLIYFGAAIFLGIIATIAIYEMFSEYVDENKTILFTILYLLLPISLFYSFPQVLKKIKEEEIKIEQPIEIINL